MTKLLAAETTSSNDEALVAGLKRGEEAAFEGLVRQYGDYLFRVALRVTRNEAEAGEAVQETFISTFRNIASFEARSSLKTWLHRLVVNAALMRRRTIERKGEVSIDELLPAIDVAREEPEWNFVESVEAMVERESVRTAVTRAIDSLPEQYRILLVLRDIEGYDTREVADLLGDTEGNVKVRLHRARSALKKLLEPLFQSEAL